MLYNDSMEKDTVRDDGRKTMITLIVCLSLIILSTATLIIYASTRERYVFDETYTRAFGSDHVRVANDGRVFCDSETEDPDHKENWQLIKNLSAAEMEEFLGVASFSSDEELREYIRNNLGCVQAKDH